MDKHRILLVDDSPNELRILMEVLKEKYAIVAATSGFQALKMIEDDPEIELVLLDVVMPDMDGYETCRKIRDLNPEMPVIFVSANTHTEEILKGFDSGGVDYLTKPIEASVVSRKVQVVIDERKRLIELTEQNESHDDLVMNVITSAGHLGTVLGFLRSGLKLKSLESLISALFDVFDGLNIDAIVQMRANGRKLNRSSSMSISPLESDLLDRTAMMSTRFLEKGSRYIVNFDNISVIIKNMPKDEVTRGDLRDNLMMIFEDSDSLIRKISQSDSSTQVVSKSQQVSKVVGCEQVKDELVDVQTTINMISDMQMSHKQTSIRILENLNHDLEEAFFKLGLTESQEDTISGIVNFRVQEIVGHIEEGMHVEENLATLSERLQHLNNKL